MRTTRKCEFCGKTFVPRSGMQRYCSESCQAEAKRIRKKRQQDLINGIEPIVELQCQEYLTFSKAAILMGCTRQYVYKLVANGKLKASRLSSRMAFVRKSDIERMFEANPYKRVIPFGKASDKPSAKKKPKEQAPTGGKEENEVLNYYSGEEVMALYKVKRSWLYTSAKRNQIPMCRIAGKNYYSKRHVEDCLGLTVDTSSITEWLTTNEVFEEFGMKPTAIRAYAYRHSIPTKKEYGIIYYSKTHIAELRQMDMLADERYCTVDEVSEKYGLSKANIHHIAKVHGIEKKKVGVRNLLLIADVWKRRARLTPSGTWDLTLRAK